MEKITQREKKTLSVFGVPVLHLLTLAVVFAFLGWIAENAAKLVTTGIIDCRFHFLPFIPVYGIVPFAIAIAVGNVDEFAPFGKKIFKTRTKKTVILSNLIVLSLFYVFVFLGELAVGNAWEYLTGVQLWDYSSQPLICTRYAGLIPTLGYGTGAYVLAKFFYPFSLRLIERKFSTKTLVIFCAIFLSLMLVDEVIMYVYLFVNKTKPLWWIIRI